VRTRLLLWVLVLFLVLPSTPSKASGSSPGYQEMAALGVETLQNWYVWERGLWNTTGWWNAANALTAVINYSISSGSSSYDLVVANTHARNVSGGFLNNYYDDEGWWALAWIDAYDWTGDTNYLNTASAIFDDMTTGWDDVCGGGIWWSKSRGYKNAIANELFLSVAAHLANRESDPDRQAQDFAWAEAEWQWFSQSGMINSRNLINDGLNGACQNNQQTTWTYNQGVILGGLAELSQQDQDPSLPATAQAIAQAAIDGLTDANGVLHDRCEPNCGGDGSQFKGIFLRNLMTLNGSFPDARYAAFAQTNAQSIWNEAQGSDHQFGLVWSGPFDVGNASRQSSALDALIAAAEMQWCAR
jgi:predicted alpha-1,6-mannanase (GH76 family)